MKKEQSEIMWEKIASIEIQVSGASRFAKEDRKPDKFYFELQTGDRSTETLIKDRVIVNNEGSIEASRDILADAIAAKLISDRTWYVLWEDLEKLYDEIN